MAYNSERYWQSYNIGRDWIAKHKRVTERLAGKSSAPIAESRTSGKIAERAPISSAVAAVNQFNEGQAAGAQRNGEKENKGEIAENDGELVSEIDPEYMQMVRETKAHRQKRDDARLTVAQKEAQSDSNLWFMRDASYLAAENLSAGSSKVAVDDRHRQPEIGREKRTRLEETQELYGDENGRRQIAISTRMDMKFEALVDGRQAQMWPNIPLNL